MKLFIFFNSSGHFWANNDTDHTRAYAVADKPFSMCQELRDFIQAQDQMIGMGFTPLISVEIDAPADFLNAVQIVRDLYNRQIDVVVSTQPSRIYLPIFRQVLATTLNKNISITLVMREDVRQWFSVNANKDFARSDVPTLKGRGCFF